MSLTKVTYSMIDGAVFNVLDFGAVGDGVADDTNAIKAAYAAASASSSMSKEIFFPNVGDGYRITDSITLADSDYSYFVGEGGHYTGSKIIVDFDGPGFHGPLGYNATNSFKNLVIKKKSGVTYANSYGIYLEGGAVENTFRECSFLDFGQCGLKINNSFAVVIDHCLIGGNYVTGLFINGGSGTTIISPIFQDNEGTALNLAGSAHTVINGFWESNCKRNDPSGENANYRNIAVSDSQSVFVGGTLNCWPADNKWPIEILGQEVTFINLNVYALGTGMPGVMYLQGSYASARLIGCRGFNDKLGGTVANVVTESVGSPGYFKPDLLLGGKSVSNGIAKAWCNFNGVTTGTNAPREGVNVTSVERISQGYYQINFTAAMSTSEYAVSSSAGDAGGSNPLCIVATDQLDPSFVRVRVFNLAGTLVDVSQVHVVVHSITSI